jgi:hypothetical protein
MTLKGSVVNMFIVWLDIHSDTETKEELIGFLHNFFRSFLPLAILFSEESCVFQVEFVSWYKLDSTIWVKLGDWHPFSHLNKMQHTVWLESERKAKILALITPQHWSAHSLNVELCSNPDRGECFMLTSVRQLKVSTIKWSLFVNKAKQNT